VFPQKGQDDIKYGIRIRGRLSVQMSADEIGYLAFDVLDRVERVGRGVSTSSATGFASGFFTAREDLRVDACSSTESPSPVSSGTFVVAPLPPRVGRLGAVLLVSASCSAAGSPLAAVSGTGSGVLLPRLVALVGAGGATGCTSFSCLALLAGGCSIACSSPEVSAWTAGSSCFLDLMTTGVEVFCTWTTASTGASCSMIMLSSTTASPVNTTIGAELELLELTELDLLLLAFCWEKVLVIFPKISVSSPHRFGGANIISGGR